MNGVISTAELLLTSELTARQRRLTTIIERSGGDLLALIDDILDLAKLEAGKFEFENIDFDLRQAIEQFVGLIRGKCRGKGPTTRRPCALVRVHAGRRRSYPHTPSARQSALECDQIHRARRSVARAYVPRPERGNHPN